MDEWEKFSETSLPEKEEFYSNLNVKDITDGDYMHALHECKNFEIYLNIMICILKVIHYCWLMFSKLCLEIY